MDSCSDTRRVSPGRQLGVSPTRAHAAGTSPGSPLRENSRAARVTGRRTPARRMLFNPHPAAEPPRGSVTASTAGWGASLGPSERKRGSEMSESGSAPGEFSASLLAFAGAAAAVAAAAAAGPTADGSSDVGGGFDAAHVTAATPNLTSSGGDWAGPGPDGFDASAGRVGEACSGGFFGKPSGAAREFDGSALGGASLIVTDTRASGSFAINSSSSIISSGSIGDGVTSSAKGLDEWKAPETGGTFSLGTPPQQAGCARRRRTVRVRGGG